MAGEPLGGKEEIGLIGRHFKASIHVNALQCENIISGEVVMACPQEPDMAVAKKDVLTATAAKKTMIAAVKFPRFFIDLHFERL